MSSTGVLKSLKENGILLLSDKALPSVVAIIGGTKVKGSWWGHEKGHEIFRQLGRLESHPDALLTRLVSGKVTYLHRKLWPDFLAVANAREGWQTQGLPPGSRRLLAEIEGKGQVRMDSYPGKSEDAREIERRLLVYTEEIHTDRGFHTKLISTWSRCPKLKDLHLPLKNPGAGRQALEKLVDALNERYHANGRLPWRQQ
jgi:hypothetical protein